MMKGFVYLLLIVVVSGEVVEIKKCDNGDEPIAHIDGPSCWRGYIPLVGFYDMPGYDKQLNTFYAFLYSQSSRGKTTVLEDKCTINEIRITPCQNKNQPCRIYKGSDASISFDFVPHFNATQLNNSVYYRQIPWAGLDVDACKATTCPTEAGKQQTYSNTLHIGKKIPTGSYTFTWQVFDASNESNTCCFKATVAIKKK